MRTGLIALVLAELYVGRELPDVLKSLMNDLVECETVGGYLLMGRSGAGAPRTESWEQGRCIVS